MDFDKLRTFCIVVETGSFQKAAEREFISQRAVSQSIKKLEEELDIKLFDREKNKIQITETGQQFYIQVSDMLNKFTVDVNSLRYQQKHQSKQLTVGYFSPFDGWLLKEKLFRHLKNYDLELKITHEGVEHLVSDVLLGLVDIASVLDYGNGLERINPNVEMTEIYDNDMVMGVSELNSLSYEEAFKIENVTKLPVLYYTSENSHYLRNAFFSTLPEEIKGTQSARISSVEQMQMLVALNQAFAFYPNGLVQQVYTSKEHIKYLPIVDSDQHYKIQLIYSKNSRKHKLIDEVIDEWSKK